MQNLPTRHHKLTRHGGAVLLWLAVLFLPSAALAQVEGTVRLGGEADDNPTRTTGEESAYTPALRAFVEANGRHRFTRRTDVGGDLRAGARYNTAVPDSSGGALEAAVRGRTFLTSALEWRLRLSLRERREAIGDRNYRLLSATTGPGLWAGGHHLALDGGVERFVFHPRPEASSTGSVAVARSRFRLAEGWALSADLSWRHRASRDAVTVPTNPDDQGGILDDSRPEERRDTLWGGGAGLEWETTRAVFELRYRFGQNDSSVYARSYQRHAMEVSATLLPVGELLVRGAFVLQRTRWTDSRFDDDSAFLEDENRNQFSLTVEHPIAWDLFGEARVTHYRQAFGSDLVDNYRRTLVYAGLAWWF